MGNCLSQSHKIQDQQDLCQQCLICVTNTVSTQSEPEDKEDFLFETPSKSSNVEVEGIWSKLKSISSMENLQSGGCVLIDGKISNNFADPANLDIQHVWMKAVWGGNFQAPVESILKGGNEKVLTINCGTRSWAIEMAKSYPSLNVTEINIDPSIEKFNSTSPYNVTFTHTNILAGLPFSDETFSFVYQTLMAITLTDFQFCSVIIPELLRVTKPEGLLEFTEMNFEFINQGPVLRFLANYYLRFLESNGINCNIGSTLKQALERTKQVKNIHYEEKIVPLGKQNGSISDLSKNSMYHLCLAQQPILSCSMKISDSEFIRMCDTIFKSEVDLYNTCIRVHNLKNRYWPDNAIGQCYRLIAHSKLVQEKA
ncbi:hypothetical protein G9A89_023007 [Geosiphon pyriformis]|nr:hypothetical protein G9A89_023007 [Geosiphon pyriformis]